jgi:hypothetical protein
MCWHRAGLRSCWPERVPAETETEPQKSANCGLLGQSPGNRAVRKTASWAWEDASLQPDRYGPAALTIWFRARSREARGQRRAILPSSMPTRRGNRAGRLMALKGATYMQSALEGSWLMPNNLLKSRQLFSRPRLNSLPCGEGLGVGVVVRARRHVGRGRPASLGQTRSNDRATAASPRSCDARVAYGSGTEALVAPPPPPSHVRHAFSSSGSNWALRR